MSNPLFDFVSTSTPLLHKCESAHINYTSMPEDDDPLKIKDLAVSYDYLMYKIHDHITTLAEKTYESVQKKQQLVENDYFHDQLHLDENIADAQELLKQCDEIQLQFMKLDQLYVFVEDFKKRLMVVESEFNRL